MKGHRTRKGTVGRYRYPLWATLWSTVPPSLCFLIGLAVLPRWVKTVFTLLYDLARGYTSESQDIQFAGTAWIPLVLGGILLTLYTEVIVSDDGIKARVFVFKWVFIPWNDVLDVIATPLLGYAGYADSQLWCFVRVRKLTPFHRLASACYLTGLEPVLIINMHIEGYEELIQIIKDHVEQNQVALRGAKD